MQQKLPVMSLFNTVVCVCWLILLALPTTAFSKSVDDDPVKLISDKLLDVKRQRQIPVAHYQPENDEQCTETHRCPVALISPGYGGSHTAYSFLAEALVEQGYLVVAVQNQLPTDPPLPTTGNLRTERLPNWRKGARNLLFVRDYLSAQHANFDWDNLLLVGHSNGGDISALFADKKPELVSGLITLDHRRYPLPRDSSIRVLSIRASDFLADPGVLPSNEEIELYPIQIIEIKQARHIDMHDGGPPGLKATILESISYFLNSNK